jgi:DNA-binding HxlR family transcriptional regulator
MGGVQEPRATSPLAEAVARVGDRWALLLVHALLAGPRRFGDLLEDVSGIAPNVLTQRLRHLEREGVVVATPYSQRPLRVVYELTAAGQELAGALRLLAQWGAGAGRADDDVAGAEPLRHPACGTPLEARWWCPTCARVTDETDDVQYL